MPANSNALANPYQPSPAPIIQSSNENISFTSLKYSLFITRFDLVMLPSSYTLEQLSSAFDNPKHLCLQTTELRRFPLGITRTIHWMLAQHEVVPSTYGFAGFECRRLALNAGQFFRTS